ncbi:MAG TPA: hypothetical protein VIW45_21280, partial [Vicinamibacterales bacterium]
MTREEFERLVKPHRERIVSVVQAAINESNEEPAGRRARQTKRTLASWRNDLMLFYLAQEFQDVPGTNLFWKGGYLHLDIEGRVLMHFKKHTNGRARSIPTKNAVRINGTAVIDGFPPNARRLVGGYESDKLGSTFKVLVSAPLKKGVEWTCELTAFDSGNDELFDRDTREITPPSGPKTVVRARNESEARKRSKS